MLNCNEVLGFLDARRTCERSAFGTKVLTQCLFPSAEPVYVHVAQWGDMEFRVSDGGAAAQCAMRHGRDADAVKAGMKAASDRFSLEIEREELIARVPNGDWLPNAVSAVANGAAFAASTALDHGHKVRQKTLRDEIGEYLRSIVPDRLIASSYEYRGRSGKLWEIDYAVLIPERPVLVKAVTPHHNSIASTYTVLSDALEESNRRLSVYSRRPDDDDAALLRQVSELVPLKALKPMAEQMLAA